MAEGTYEHACMRAELLGLDKPNKDDFLRNQPEASRVEHEKIEAAQFEDISLQNDDLNKTSGGLTELNTILSSTQRRLNKLKGVCGSLTDLLRNRMGGSKDNMSYSTDPSYIATDSPAKGNMSKAHDNMSKAQGNINHALDDLDTMRENQNLGMAKDISQQVSSQVDKLDSLLMKAENAQYSMEHQNKQMKKFIQK